MTVKDYLGVIRERIPVVVLVVILTTASALLFSVKKTPRYEANSELLVIPLTLSGAGEELTRKFQFQRGTATEARIVASTEVAIRVIKRLNLDRAPFDYNPKKLLDDIIVVPADGADVVEINVEAPDPRLARDMANAIPEEYIALRRAQALKQAQDGSEYLAKEVRRLLDRLNEIDAQLQGTDPLSTRGQLLQRQRDETVGSMASLEATRQKLIDESPLKNRGVGQIIKFATVPKKRSDTDLIRTTVLGFAIGIPLAFGLALLIDSMSDAIKLKGEAEAIVGAEVIGVIPMSSEWRSSKPYISTREAPYSAAAEAFRTLRINLESKAPLTEARRILFTSPAAGEGKTLTSANLVVAFAEAGRSAMAVSVDLRRPRLHRLFGIDVAPGFSDVLSGDSNLNGAIHEVSPLLYILPSGNPVERPDQLISRADIEGILGDLTVQRVQRHQPPRNDENGIPVSEGSGKGDSAKPTIFTQPNIMLLDAPAVLGAAEVSVMASAVDGVVLVLHAGITRRESAARAAEQIRRAGGKILGVVLVGVRMDEDYNAYPPISGDSVSEGVWSKVVGALRQ